MTLISASSVALTILNQSSFTVKTGQKETGSTILDIVFGRRPSAAQAIEEISALASKATKAKLETAEKRETVSAVISQASMSAMNAAAANIISYDIKPIERTAENAEIIVNRLIVNAARYNQQFQLDIIIAPREEYNAKYMAWGMERVANGEDETLVKNQVDYFTSDRVYDGQVALAEFHNSTKSRYSGLHLSQMEFGVKALVDFFGSAINLKYNENGHAYVTSGNLYYKNGQKMLSYTENGELEIYGQDGIITRKYTKYDIEN